MDLLWPLLISGVLLFGYLYFYSLLGAFEIVSPATNRIFGIIIVMLPLLHLVAVFSPWMVEADCENGQPWALHLSYAIVAVLAAPILAGLVFAKDSYEQMERKLKVPIFSCLTPFCKWPYLYATTIAAAADQFLDNNTAALAKACDYEHFEMMVVLFACSLLAQGVTGAMVSFLSMRELDMQDVVALFLLVIAGVNTDGLAKAFGTSTDDERGVEMCAWVACVRFFTECCPQAGFAIDFAIARGLTGQVLALVVASVIFSLLVAGKSALTGINYLCGEKIKAKLAKVSPEEIIVVGQPVG